MKKALYFFIVLATALSMDSPKPAAIVTTEQMLGAIKRINTISMEVRSIERMPNRIADVSQKLEACFNPFSAKLKFIEPNNGSVVKFQIGKNENEILYIPNGFPYFNINVNPLGNLARRNNHHTIYEAGFGYLADILNHEIEQNHELMTLKEEKYNNIDCILLEAKHDDYSFVKYKMEANETVRDLALKKRISEYKIIEKNNQLDFYDEHTYKEILIPNYYCKQIKIYIDKANLLPSSIQIFDEEGLFEQYDYDNVIVNPNFKSDYFDIK